MNSTVTYAVTLSLLAGCASERVAPEDEPASTASTPSVSLQALEGEWRRDDGHCYRLVRDGERLIGYRLGDLYYGCRVELTLTANRLEGIATFLDTDEDAATALETTWTLNAKSADELNGTVGAFDVAPENGEVIGQTSEAHAFVRQSTFSASEADAARAVARVHRLIDAAVRSADRGAALAALMSSPAVRALASNPERASVATRLQAVFRASGGTTILAAAAAAARAEAERAADAGADVSGNDDGVGDGDESGPAPVEFSGAWTNTELKTLAGLSLGDAHGWEGEYNASLESWTYEKYTPGPDGFNEVNRFTLDTFPADAPSDVKAYATKLVEDESFQDYGYRYEDVSHQEVSADGFLIVGTVVDTSDDEVREPGFVLALTVGKFRLLAKGSTFTSDALRAEAIALAQALVPLLEASSTPAPHSDGHVEEMNRFLATFDGSSSSVEKALGEFGIVGLASQDMHYYDLKEPTIVGREAGEIDWFTFEVKSGMIIRTYRAGWKDGSIVEVEDKGMR